MSFTGSVGPEFHYPLCGRQAYLLNLEIKLKKAFVQSLSHVVINRSIISRLIKKFLQTGCTSHILSGGRPYDTSRHEGSLIKRTI